MSYGNGNNVEDKLESIQQLAQFDNKQQVLVEHIPLAVVELQLELVAPPRVVGHKLFVEED
jgi:hypothetical protein